MVLALELVGPSHRAYTAVILNIAYSCSLIILAVVVYFVRIWTQLSLATAIPFPAFWGFWWVLPESPRWLLAKGRVDEAFKIMETIMKVNKRPLQECYLQSSKMQFTKDLRKETERGTKKKQKTWGGVDLFRTPNLRKKTLILTFIWFTNTLVYVGLSYYAPSLGGDSYLNFFLAGVSELPTYLFLWPSMEYCGRRWTLCFSMVVGGSACMATFLTQDKAIVTLVLYCIGKFGISSSFVVLPLFAAELYPTVVRGVGLGISSTAGMIGPVVIPLINYLGNEMMVLPLIIMGTLLVIGGSLALLLPETLHQNLPQTIEDGENFGKNMVIKDYCNCCPRWRVDHSNDELDEPPDIEITKNVDEISVGGESYQESYSSLRRGSFLKAQNSGVTFKTLAVDDTSKTLAVDDDNTRLDGNLSCKKYKKVGKNIKNRKGESKATTITVI